MALFWKGWLAALFPTIPEMTVCRSWTNAYGYSSVAMNGAMSVTYEHGPYCIRYSECMRELRKHEDKRARVFGRMSRPLTL